MQKNKRVRMSSGIIARINPEIGLVGVNNAAGRITNYFITRQNLFDNEGNPILIDELKTGDQVVINENGYTVVMKVFKIA